MKDSQKNSPIWSILSKRFIVVILLVLAYLAAGLTLHFVVPAFTWHWFIFGLIAVVIPAGLICFYDIVNKIVDPSSDQKKQASKVFIKYTVFYWFADCLYMAIFNGWTPWIFALGILFVVLVLINLANAFLSNNKSNTASNFFVVLDLVVGLVATVYLIYIIPQELLNLQTIVTTIVAAVYGGLLTLVGVAWTIRHNAKEKELEEIKRLKDIKELERKKNIPFLTIVKYIPENCIRQEARLFLFNLCRNDNDCNFYYNIEINDFGVKNISNSILLLEGAKINGQILNLNQKIVMEPGSYCVLRTGNRVLTCSKEIENFLILANDILGNHYEIKCSMNIDFGNLMGRSDNGELAGKSHIHCIYTINEAEIPRYLDGQ